MIFLSYRCRLLFAICGALPFPFSRFAVESWLVFSL